MKTEQEQVEAMSRNIYNSMRYVIGVTTIGDIAKSLFSAGYGDISEYKAENERLTKILNSLTFSKKETDIFGKPALLMFAGVKVEEAIKRVAEYDGLNAEIERLKDGYARVQEQLRVQEQFAKYQIVSDKEIKARRKQAQIDVLNELKKKTHNYYPSIDSYCISQHIVLVRDIDELIKEVQDGEDKS